jgi:hypothetical protein
VHGTRATTFIKPCQRRTSASQQLLRLGGVVEHGLMNVMAREEVPHVVLVPLANPGLSSAAVFSAPTATPAWLKHLK